MKPFPALHEQLAACVPREWRREVRLSRLGQGGVIRFRDDKLAAHSIEFQPMGVMDGWFLRGPVLTYRYTEEEAALGEEIRAEYRDIIRKIIPLEPFLLGWLANPVSGEPGNSHRMFLERELLARWEEAVTPEGFQDWVRGEVGAGAKATVYLENPCLQACEFCILPLARAIPIEAEAFRLLDERTASGRGLWQSGAFGALLEVLESLSPPGLLVISGNDWAIHREIAGMLAELSGRKGVSVSFLGPSTRLAEREFAKQVACLPGLSGITLTLQAGEPGLHDAIVGREGAGEAVLAAIRNLQELGITPTVHTVLSRRTLTSLGAHLEAMKARELRVSLLAFIPDRLMPGWPPEGILPSAKEIRVTLEEVLQQAGNSVAALIGLPVCAVPPALRNRLRPGTNGLFREPAVFPAPCEGCRWKKECVGVPESHGMVFGATGVEPE